MGQFMKQKPLGMIKWVVRRCFWTSRTILITIVAFSKYLEDLSTDIPRD